MRERNLALQIGLAAAAAFYSGCGATYYAVQVAGAASRVEEARTVHAAELAPYEYYFAREHLYRAQIEAGDANFSDAANFASIAEDYAGRAIAIADKSRSGEDPAKAGDGEKKSDKGGNGETSTDHDNDSSP